jgi:hypothetical protein
MNRMLPLAGAALLLAAGCNDQSDEIARVRAEQQMQRTRLDENEERWAAERKQLQDDIAALRAQLGQAGPDEAKPLQERLAELEAKAAGDTDWVADVEARLDGVKAEAVAAAREEAAKGGGMVDEDRVAELAAKKLAEQQANSTPTKNLKQALARLDISQAEQEMVRQEIISAKKGILETLEVPTTTGRNLAVELIDKMLAVQNGDAEQSDLMGIFGDLATLKVPGDASGRTYMDAINAIKKKNRETIGRILTPEDQSKLTRAHEDWTDFEVGEGDPWGALYLERLEAYQKRKEKLKEAGFGD